MLLVKNQEVREKWGDVKPKRDSLCNVGGSAAPFTAPDLLRLDLQNIQLQFKTLRAF